MDGKNAALLTPEDATHEITLSDSGDYFVDSYSKPDVPPVAVLRDLTGKLVLTLEKADISKLLATGWKPPTPVTVKGRDNQTDLYGLMFKPTNLDPAKKYPIVNHIYPGPQTGSVGSRSFSPARGDAQALAELGFVVVEIDGMGTPWRSKKFHEAYFGDMPGITKDTQLESWSMGKSITSTLFALLVKDGTYSLEQPAPVAAWRAPDDPRSKIRNIDLLRMSGGLRFLAEQDPDYSPDKGYPDHFYIYTGAVDAFEYSINRPLQFPPNTEGRYRNCDPLTIGYLIKLAVQQRGQEYLTWPQKMLFDRIGIRRQVLETDPYGNFLMTGYDYGTARNWARIGLLYAQDGMWQGQRILPEGWTTFVSTPAPAWKRPVYGGLFWVNGDEGWNLPKDTYFAAGAGGQNTWIVPGRDVVIVRMGHMRGQAAARRATNTALGLVMEAIRP